MDKRYSTSTYSNSIKLCLNCTSLTRNVVTAVHGGGASLVFLSSCWFFSVTFVDISSTADLFSVAEDSYL